ncbi:hypothetical protein BLA29_003394 [Euroglyphus maynei]|uniref:Ig-like domain-containing protein n=1 Tax=Euroglyphus maynei TaxID=6958 RepID=A0A1Y3B383_EURMA|nr:hypothetical protein BLA29_003394 [Euroglyphus maynei]
MVEIPITTSTATSTFMDSEEFTNSEGPITKLNNSYDEISSPLSTNSTPNSFMITNSSNEAGNSMPQTLSSTDSILVPEYVLNLNVSSSFVSNCTDVEFYCEISSLKPIADNPIINSSVIWWTFRGQNVSSSTLPGGRVINRQDNTHLSILDIECAQFGVHDGDYRCHSSSLSSTEISGSQQFSITNSSNLHFEISVEDDHCKLYIKNYKK